MWFRKKKKGTKSGKKCEPIEDARNYTVQGQGSKDKLEQPFSVNQGECIKQDSQVSLLKFKR